MFFNNKKVSFKLIFFIIIIFNVYFISINKLNFKYNSNYFYKETLTYKDANACGDKYSAGAYEVTCGSNVGTSTSIKVKLKMGDKYEIGEYYRQYFKDKNGNQVPIFCLTFGKEMINGSILKSLKTSILEFSDQESLARMTGNKKFPINIIYNLYEKYSSTYAKDDAKTNYMYHYLTQVAIWYALENGSLKDSSVALEEALMVRDCKFFSEHQLGTALGNEKFSCDVWVSCEKESDCSKNGEVDIGAAYKNKLGDMAFLSMEDYRKTIKAILTNPRISPYNQEQVSQKIKAYSDAMRGLGLYNPDNYTGQYNKCGNNPLAIWLKNGNPVESGSRYQAILAPYFTVCPPIKTCKTDLDEFLEAAKKDYGDNYWENTLYMNALDAFANDHSGKVNIDDPQKPYCGDTCKSLEESIKQVDSDLAKNPSGKKTIITGGHKGKPAGPLTIDLVSRKNTLEQKMKDIHCGDPDPQTCDGVYSDMPCKTEAGYYSLTVSDATNDSGQRNDTCILEYNSAYSINNENVEAKDPDLGNKYCEIYCWETFKTYFPSGLEKVKAGTTFFWGLDKTRGIFGNINVTRHCTAPKIDYVSFNSDFSSNETAILKAYNAYKAQEKYNSQPVKSVAEGCVYGSHTTKGKGDEVCCDCDASSKGCTAADGAKPCTSETKDGVTCWYWWVDVTVQDKGTKYYKEQQSYGTGDNIKYSSNDTVCLKPDADSSGVGATLNSNYLSERKKDLNKVISNRQTLLDLITNCQSISSSGINSSSIYKYGTTVKLKLKEPVTDVERDIPDGPIELTATQSSGDIKFSDSGQREKDDSNKDASLVINCTSTPGISDVEDLKYCQKTTTVVGENTVVTGYVSVAKFKEYNWYYDGTYRYKYPNSLYWYALKQNAYLVNSNDTNFSKYFVGAIVPYEIGYGIPLGFQTIENYYDISVDVENIGHAIEVKDADGKVISTTYHFDKLVKQNISPNSVYNYKCSYHVKNKIYGNECVWSCNAETETCELVHSSPKDCNTKVHGLDLVYRVIQLDPKDKTVVFPGLKGGGRDPGFNWASFVNTFAYKNIMNHDLIYDSGNGEEPGKSGPIYSIDLTPTLINEIRESNRTYRKNGKDPYTSYIDPDGKDKIVCVGETINQTCASDWLSTYIGKGIITGQYCRCGENERCSDTKDRAESIATKKNQYKGKEY